MHRSTCHTNVRFEGFNILRKIAYDTVESRAGSSIIFSAIVFSTTLLAMERHHMGTALRLTIYYSNIALTALFAVELVVKVLGLGVVGYARDAMNVLDGVAVLHSLIERGLDTGI